MSVDENSSAKRPTRRGVRAGVEDRHYFKDGTPKAQCGKGLRWRVRYVAEDGGPERSKNFRTERDAKAFLRDNTAAVVTGSYVDKSRSEVTVGEVAEVWERTLATRTAGTRNNYKGVLRRYVRPRWSEVRVRDVDHAAVVEWLADLTEGGGETGEGLAAQTVQHAHRVLSLVLDHAVKAGNLRVNPARSLARGELPRKRPAEQRFLTVAELRQLGAAVDYLASQREERQRAGKRLGAVQVDKDAAGASIIPEVSASQDGTMVRLMAWTGLRWGEAAGLRVKRVNLDARTLHVTEAVSEVGGKLVWGHTKGHADRYVTFPAFLSAEVSALVAGKRPDELVFPSSEGTALRNPNFRKRTFDPAVKLAELEPLRIHDLRHTFASLAVAAGADVKVLQAALGHKDAAMTLNTYASLLGDKAATVADALDKLAAG